MAAGLSLNVIALVSGGKDSFFCILHCIENGHKVVALANLHPPADGSRRAGQGENKGREVAEDDAGESEGEDLNSFMYQTVGHSVIPLYAECLGLPLYRRAITGSAVQTGRYYDAGRSSSTSTSSSASTTAAADETEDLLPLLQGILRAHPEADALCSGAILSTYQRTRVESIAVRLGLTPLAYLWQYPALPPPGAGRADSLTGLLEDMDAAGCDARIIKIASGGIKESLLWANVADPRTRARLVSGLRPFFPEHEFWLRGAVLGEGGEYETLAINGPTRLWKKRIEIPQEENRVLSGEGGVSYVRLAKAKTVPNDSSEDDHATVRVPHILDRQFDSILTNVGDLGKTLVEQENQADLAFQHSTPSSSSAMMQSGSQLTSQHLAMSNLTVSSAESINATSQMRQICQNLTSHLASISTSHDLPSPLTPSNIVFTMLLLKDMSDFAAVNQVYSSLFRLGQPNPPARVTLATYLPDGVEVSLSVVLDCGPREARRALHVQSRSYWAPANIGPYSQAICVPVIQQDQDGNVHDAGLIETVHMAGQIPLIPQSMQLSQATFVEQAVLSLQHLWRVGQERGADMWPWGVAFLKESNDAQRRAVEASSVWRQAHQIGTPGESSSSESDNDEAGPDAWDIQYNRHTSNLPETVGEHLHILPNKAVFNHATATDAFVPPFIAAEVVSLPRDAPVEWWSVGMANLPKTPSQRRASIDQKGFGWGSIIRITVPGQSDDADPEEQSIVVTVLVHVARGLTRSDHTDAVAIEKDVWAWVSRRLDVKPRVMNGTAFIAREGQAQWLEMQRHGRFGTLTVVPCRTLYGSTDLDGTIDDEEGRRWRERRREPEETSKRLDSSGKTGLPQPSTPSVSCQPLAMAMTLALRLD